MCKSGEKDMECKLFDVFLVLVYLLIEKFN